MNQTQKKNKYLVKFENHKEKWTVKYPFLISSKREKTCTLCMLCNTNFSIGHGEENDVKRQIELRKHADSVKASASS